MKHKLLMLFTGIMALVYFSASSIFADFIFDDFSGQVIDSTKWVVGTRCSNGSVVQTNGVLRMTGTGGWNDMPFLIPKFEIEPDKDVYITFRVRHLTSEQFFGFYLSSNGSGDNFVDVNEWSIMNHGGGANVEGADLATVIYDNSGEGWHATRDKNGDYRRRGYCSGTDWDVITWHIKDANYDVAINGILLESQVPGTLARQPSKYFAIHYRPDDRTPGQGIEIDYLYIGNTPIPESLGISPGTVTDGLCSTVWPQNKYDNTLYICKGSAQHINIVFGNKSKALKLFRFILEMPDGLSLVPFADRPQKDVYYSPYFPVRVKTEKIERAEKRYTRYVLDFEKPISGNIPLESVPSYRTLPVLIKAEEEVTYKTADIFYSMEGGVGEIEPQNRLKVEVLLPLNGKQPQKINIAMQSWTIGNEGAFAPGFEADAILNTWRNAGLNMLALSGGSEGEKGERFLQQLRQKRFRAIGNFFWFWWDRNGKYLKAHPEASAVDFSGKQADLNYIHSKICPTVLLDSKSGAMDDLLVWLSEYVRRYVPEGVYWDLEGPSVFDVCFCQRCVGEFKHLNKITEELTPEIIKNKYRSQWVDFACSQSAGLAKRLREAVHAGNPDARFYVFATGSPARQDVQREDCRGDLSQLCNVIDAMSLNHYVANSSIIARWLSGDVSYIYDFFRKIDSKIPVGMWLCTGSTREEKEDFMEYPDCLKLEIIEYIAGGFTDGVYLFYDEPCDGRFYQAIAGATKIVSELEDYFLEGRQIKDWLKLPEGMGLHSQVLEKGFSKVVLIYNHNLTEAKSVELNIPLGKGEKIITYPDRKVSLEKNIKFEIKPLDVAILFVNSD